MMEVLSSSQPSLRCCGTEEEGKVECKCVEGWSCSVTKTDSSKAGKPFCICSTSDTTCICVDESESTLAEVKKALEGSLGCKVVCKTDAGYTCKITNAGKVIAECGEGCICIVDETGSIKCITKAAETSCCTSSSCN
ncbi:uncharacterized protein [Nicotiana tomentosiformis]|uniref:Uncharacterized protein n=1 Tax=Nicotiana tabacum TaxID=4097 RepID=A0A1S4B3R8_TOBAC|nr:uncharacterized protein LOC104108754 [Nicotiana tomentosiformis]XP_016483575.1 PREDICTED: uncharacterized protein LOC107804237 [Nicotiana tabacum]